MSQSEIITKPVIAVFQAHAGGLQYEFSVPITPAERARLERDPELKQEDEETREFKACIWAGFIRSRRLAGDTRVIITYDAERTARNN